METEKKIKLFTDSDLDGIACGIIADACFGDDVDILFTAPKQIDTDIKEFISSGDYKNYKKTFITDLVISDSTANMLNTTLSRHEIALFDHHKTNRAINSYPWAVVNEYYNQRKTCGAELFWEYIKDLTMGCGNYKSAICNIDSYDQFIEYVRMWDTWEWTEKGHEGEIAKNINTIFGMYSNTKFLKTMRRKLSEENVVFIDEFEKKLIEIDENKKKRYIIQKSKTLRKLKCSEFTIGVVFAEDYISELGNCLCKLNNDIDFVAMINPDIKVISLRTIKDNIDLAVIAKKCGGGGHPKSAGFTYNTETDNKILNYIFTGTDMNER